MKRLKKYSAKLRRERRRKNTAAFTEFMDIELTKMFTNKNIIFDKVYNILNKDILPYKLRIFTNGLDYCKTITINLIAADLCSQYSIPLTSHKRRDIIFKIISKYEHELFNIIDRMFNNKAMW